MKLAFFPLIKVSNKHHNIIGCVYYLCLTCSVTWITVLGPQCCDMGQISAGDVAAPSCVTIRRSKL